MLFGIEFEPEMDSIQHQQSVDFDLSDDSEEQEYPVQPSASRLWNEFSDETSLAIKNLVRHRQKSASATSQRKSSSSLLERVSREIDNDNERSGSDIANLHELEDLARQADFSRTTDLIRAVVAETISAEQRRQVQEARALQEARQVAAETERLTRADNIESESTRASNQPDLLIQKTTEQNSQRESQTSNIDRGVDSGITLTTQKTQEVPVNLNIDPIPLSDPATGGSRLDEEQVDTRRSKAAHMSEAEENRADIQRFKDEVLLSVSKSSALRLFCSKIRLKIKPRIGQLTNSMEQISQVLHSLKEVLDDASKQDGNKLCLRWSLNYLCKAIANQAESEVMVSPLACYPLAFLVNALMRLFPELLEIYLRRLKKKCPWIIPCLAYDLSTESGRKSLGWKRVAGGKYEEVNAYIERQEGLFRLWLASASLETTTNQITVTLLWRSVSSLLNCQIVDPDLSNGRLAMLSAFLDIAGRAFVKAYRGQADKLIAKMHELQASHSRSPFSTRLSILLDRYLDTNEIGLAFSFVS